MTRRHDLILAHLASLTAGATTEKERHAQKAGGGAGRSTTPGPLP